MTQEFNPYDAVIADLDKKIADMTAIRETLKQLREMGITMNTAADALKANVAQDAAGFRHDSFFNMTIPDAVRKYLSATKKTASIAELAEALPKYGLKTTAKNFGETLRAILSRHPDFVKINREFGLTEWYPGRGATKRGRRSAEDQAESGAEPTGDSASAEAVEA